MTDESKTQPGLQTTPPSKPGFGAPARHDFGDKPDRTTPKTNPTETEDSDADDAGEGHKGPLVDATKGSDATKQSGSNRPQGTGSTSPTSAR